MFSPPCTHQASALVRLPAEPQYWMENLPVGHGKYNSGIFTFLLLVFARSGSNNTRSVVYTTQMITIHVINRTVCFNFTTGRICVVKIKITPTVSYGTQLV